MNTELTDEQKANIMERRWLFRSYFPQSPEHILATLDSLQRKARTRLLEHHDVYAFLDEAAEIISQGDALGLPRACFYADLDAGAVTTNYRYRADTSAIRIRDNTITVSRRGARRVAGGDNGRALIGYVNLELSTKISLKSKGWDGMGGVWTP